MSYVWEPELQPSKYAGDDNLVWRVEHHLKKCLPKTEGSAFDYKISVAWIVKISDRKWRCSFITTYDESRTFRSLKAAKAYTVAIITLEN
jgi:hypothetical protein